jgi:PAS domain S-box-containing protein
MASIATQLRYGLVSIVVSSLLLTGGLLSYLSFRTQLQASRLLQIERSRAVASEINAYLNRLQQPLLYLSEVRGLMNHSVADQQRLLEGITRYSYVYEGVSILDRNGQVVAAQTPDDAGLLDPQQWIGSSAHSALILQTFRHQRQYISAVKLNPTTHLPVVDFAVPLRNQNNEVDGVLFARLNLRFLWTVVAQTQVGETGYTYILDDYNFLIAQKGSLPKTFKLQALPEPLAQQLKALRRQPLDTYVGLNGTEVLGAAAPIPTLNWQVVVELPTAEAYAPIYRMLIVMGGVLGIVTVAVVGLGFVFSRQVVVPLQHLTTAAARISEGHLDTQVTVGAANELGVLATTFNQMTQQLQELFTALEQERNFVSAILDIADALVVVLDPQGRIIRFNQACERTTGHAFAAIHHQPIWNFLPPEAVAPAQAAFAQLLAQGESYQYEGYWITQSHEQRLIAWSDTVLRNDQGAIAYVISTGIDITERRLAELTLQESEARFRRLVETAQEGVWVLDDQAQTSYVNQRMADMLGYAPENMLGKYLFDFMDAAAAADAECQFERRRQGIKENHDFRFQRQDGSALWAIVSTSPVFTDTGEFMGVLGMLSDITDRKQAEKDLETLVAKLELSNRELQDFAFVASHDLQEPLRKIQAFGDRLKLKCADSLSPEGKDYLERMQNAARRMQTLINDLLAFSRITTKAQPFTPVDLGTIVQEVLSDIEVQIQRVGGCIEAACLPTIEADPLQMRQLFQNLISNALKFHQSDRRPIVRISAQILGTEPSTSPPESHLCQIYVEDNGIGFDEKYLDRIFTVFQRLHGRGEYEGTGVGLAICRKIVERHRGSITAKSTLGQGTVFIVTLPLHQTL